MKIGIVIHSGAFLFSNGITQNAYFIYQCLENNGYTCSFLCNDAEPKPFSYRGLPLTTISTDLTVFNPTEYALIITVTRGITGVQHEMFHRYKIPVIGFICGNHYMQDLEDFIRGPRESGKCFTGKAVGTDEIWLISSFAHSRTYFEVLRKCPVYMVPHLWHHSPLKERAASLSKVDESALFYNIAKHTGKKIDIVIVEPNISFCKNAWGPLLACEKLHMMMPDLIDNVYVFNFPGHNYAHAMADELTLGSKLRRFNRLEIDEILVFFSKKDTVPIFITHHILTSLNYLYYELLYYGYPLVHNSEDLGGCGYLYSDIDSCVEEILNAYKHHNKHIDTYKENALAYLENINPLNPIVGNIWKQLISSALATASSW